MRKNNVYNITLAIALVVTCNLVQAADDANSVVVSQGGVSVTLGDLDAYIRRVPEKDRAGFMDSPKRVESVLGSLLRTKQLAQQAKDMGLDKDESTQRQIALAEDEVLAKDRVERYVSELKVPDLTKLAQETYTANKEKYVQPARTDVKHVLIAADKHDDAQARELAETVHAQAVAKPADFDALVDRYSEDPTKITNHGLMPDATSMRYAKEFAQAAGALHKPGDVSPVVHTKFGYHVLMLVAQEPAKQRTFAEVKGKVLESLKAEYVNDQRKSFLGGLSTDKLQANDDVLATLRTRYLPPGAVLPEDAAAASQSSDNEGVAPHN